MSLCIAGAGGVVAKLALVTFTLAWTHTIEKTRWEEDWRIVDQRLVAVEARIQGTGAGMEPPEGAVLKDGVYRWRPSLPGLAEIYLRRAPEAGDWTVCADGTCREMGAILGAHATDPVRLYPCE